MTLAEKLLELVEVDSVIGREDALCDVLCQRLGQQPALQLERIDNSFVLWPKTRNHSELVALAGHLDTVPPSRPNPPRIEGGRLYGLGAADMKSGLALMIQLLEQPPSDSFGTDLAYIFYSGEEGPYTESGLGPLLEHLKERLPQIDLALCLEPTDNTLQLGCLGTMHAELTFHGRAAHSARPWQGQNAIYLATDLLAKLAALKPRDITFGDLLYREVLAATLAHGGSARNAVPDSFVLNLNYRFAPDRSVDSAIAYLREFVGDHATIEIKDIAPPGRVPHNNHTLERFRRVCGVEEVSKQAWTDVGRFCEAGVDAVNFGPGENAQCHQPDESTSIALLEEGNQLLRRFLCAR